MKTKLMLGIAMHVLAALTSAHAVDRTWINTSGGAFIGATTNWSSGTTPGTGDVVLFDGTGAAATYTVTLGANYTFQGLRNQAGDSVTLDLNGKTLTLTTLNAIFSHGVLNIQNGTLAASFATAVLNFGREGTATSTLTGVTASTSAFSVGTALTSSVNSSNSLVVLDGGSRVTATGATAIGAQSSSTNSKLLVKGAGTLFAGENFRVGTSNSKNNTLEVSDGGALTGLGLLIGSYHSGGGVYSLGGNTVLVHGQGALPNQNSKITLTGAVNVGAPGIETTVDNSLIVEDHGELTTTSTLIVNGTTGNTNNRVVVGKNGSLTAGATTVNFGYIAVNGGKFTTNGNLVLNNNGRLNLLDGEITINGNITTGATGGRFGFDLTGDNPITFAGIHVTGSFTPALASGFVDIFGVNSVGSYTLFTIDGTNTTSARLALGDTPVGFEGSLIFNTHSVVLQVTAVPEPGATALLLIGLSATVMRFRHRLRIPA